MAEAEVEGTAGSKEAVAMAANKEAEAMGASREEGATEASKVKGPRHKLSPIVVLRMHAARQRSRTPALQHCPVSQSAAARPCSFT